MLNSKVNSYFVLVLPGLFVIWAVLVITQAWRLQSDVDYNVNAISFLKDVEMYVGSSDGAESKTLQADTERWSSELEMYKEVLLPELRADLEGWVAGDRPADAKAVNAHIQQNIVLLRTTLRDISVTLKSLWWQLSIIGIVACVLALLAGYLYVKGIRNRELIIKGREELQTTNEELEASNKQLREANRLKNRLFSIISHDLRSPVGAVKMFLEVVEAKDFEEGNATGHLRILRKNVNRIYATLENTLIWARNQFQGEKINITQVELSKMIHECVELEKWLADQKEIRFEFEIPCETWVQCDEAMINVVIRNMLNNAIKFSRSGSEIRLRSGVEDSVCILKISDQGVGMAEGELNKLNSDETLSSSVGTSGEKGSGLGIILSRELVRKNNGNLRFDSKLDVGTTAVIELPKA